MYILPPLQQSFAMVLYIEPESGLAECANHHNMYRIPGWCSTFVRTTVRGSVTDIS